MTTIADLNQKAKEILTKNDRGGYTIPTAGLYPYQWNWDSAFAALGFAAFDVKRAWQELETLFFGSVGWWDGPAYRIPSPRPGIFSGPRCLGRDGACTFFWHHAAAGCSDNGAVHFERDQDGSQEAVRALFPKMRAWHNWFFKWRLDQGAACVTHPWEAGRDNTPEWDDAMARIDPVGVGEYERRDTTHVDGSMRPTKFDYDRYVWLVQMGNRLKWNQQKLLEENPFRIADPTMTFILLRGAPRFAGSR